MTEQRRSGRRRTRRRPDKKAEAEKRGGTGQTARQNREATRQERHQETLPAADVRQLHPGHPERRRCYDTAKTYADSFPQRAEHGEGLYIEGTYGTGKTHLAAAIALQLIGCGVPVVCKTSGDLLADIKEAFDSGDDTEYEILKAYKTVDLLIVDDLGKEQCTEWSVSTLYSILNDRYEDMKPTIITTNYNADELVRAPYPERRRRHESPGHHKPPAGGLDGHHNGMGRLQSRRRQTKCLN